MEKIDQYIATGVEMIMLYVPKLIMAIVFLIIGLIVIKWMTKTLKSYLKKRDLDVTLQSFLSNLLSVLLKIMLGISVISMLGVEATSFIAVLGAAGLAVGLALSGTLQNFAGGVILLIFKPFSVGHFIKAQGYEGVVEEIQLFVTILKTADNQLIILPNGQLSNNAMVNVTKNSTRRVDLVFGIGYGDDIDKARSIIRKVIENDDRILKEPKADIRLFELADSSVNFKVRPWVKTPDYWDVYFDMTEAVKKAFDKEGVSIPFPQRDIHMIPVQN